MNEDQPQSILSHLDELRWRLVKAFIGVIVGAIVALFFSDTLRELLEAPFYDAVEGNTLQALQVGEEWGVLMRIALFGGVILASPVILYQLWAFINPALTNRERRWAVPIVSALVVLFIGGVLFGYWIYPRGLTFLLEIFPEVENNLLIGEYYSFTLRFLLAFGLSFLFPVFLFAVAAAGVITSAQLASWRRWALLVVVIGAALLTPSGDAGTLLALSIPLYLMYELTYWLVRFVLRR